MALTANEIAILIKAKDQASGTMKDIEKNAGGLSKGLGTGLKVAALAGAAGLAALGTGLVLCVKDAMEAQKVMTQTEAVLASTGGVSGMTAKSVSDLAESLSKVIPVDDELIQSTENMLLTFTRVGKDIFPQATEAALNMATALGGDPVDAAMKLGKALNDPIAGVTALRKVGVMLTDQQKDQIKAMVEAGDVAGAQAVILKELETEFGNSGRAAGKTMAGQLKILQTQIGNVKEKIGLALIPVLTKLLTFITGSIVPVFSKWADVVIPRVGSAFKALGDILGPLIKYFQAVVVDGDVMNDWLTHLPEPIQGVVKALGEFYVAMQELIPAVASQVFADFKDTILPGIVSAFEKIKGPLTTLIGLFGDLFKGAGTGAGDVNKVAVAVEVFLGLLTLAALAALTSFVTGIAAMVANFVLMPIKMIWDAGAAIKNFVNEAKKMVSKAVTITQKVVQTGQKIISGLVDTVQTITQNIKRVGIAITDFANKVQTITQKVKVDIPPAEQQAKAAGEKVSKGMLAGFLAHVTQAWPHIVGAAVGGGLVVAIEALKAGTVIAVATALGTALVAALAAAAVIAVGAIGIAAWYAIPVAIVAAIIDGLKKVPWGDVAGKILYGLGAAVTLVLVALAEIFILIPLAIHMLIATKLKDFGIWIWETILPSLVTFGTKTVPDFFTKTVPEWAGKVTELITDAFVDFGKWIADTALPGIGKFIVEDLPLAFTEGIPNILATIAQKAVEIGQAIISGIVDGIGDLISDPKGTLISWVFNPFAIGVLGILGDIGRIAAGIGQTIIGGIGDALGAMGATIGKQFIKGIQDAWEWAKANDPTGLLKHFSPSLAGIEVGIAFAEGIAKGISSNANRIMAAVAAMNVPVLNGGIADVAGLQHGGLVRHTQLALVHAGETVVPAGSSSGNTYNITLEMNGPLLGDRRQLEEIASRLEPVLRRRMG